MTAPRSARHPAAATPPPRPRFEFRARPSTAAERRPRAVDAAVVLCGAAALLALAAAVVMVLDLDTIRTAVRGVVDRDFAVETPATRDRAAGIAVAVLVAGTFLVGPLLAAVGVALRARRGAGRAGLVVVLALTVVLIVLATGVVPPLVPPVLVGAVGTGLAAVVAAALPPARAWFARRR